MDFFFTRFFKSFKSSRVQILFPIHQHIRIQIFIISSSIYDAILLFIKL